MPLPSTSRYLPSGDSRASMSAPPPLIGVLPVEVREPSGLMVWLEMLPDPRGGRRIRGDPPIHSRQRRPSAAFLRPVYVASRIRKVPASRLAEHPAASPITVT